MIPKAMEYTNRKDVIPRVESAPDPVKGDPWHKRRAFHEKEYDRLACAMQVQPPFTLQTTISSDRPFQSTLQRS